jgi:hypothetical protein
MSAAVAMLIAAFKQGDDKGAPRLDDQRIVSPCVRSSAAGGSLRSMRRKRTASGALFGVRRWL